MSTSSSELRKKNGSALPPKFYEFRGARRTLKEILSLIGTSTLKRSCLRNRLTNGWDIERAVSTPAREWSSPEKRAARIERLHLQRVETINARSLQMSQLVPLLMSLRQNGHVATPVLEKALRDLDKLNEIELLCLQNTAVSDTRFRLKVQTILRKT